MSDELTVCDTIQGSAWVTQPSTLWKRGGERLSDVGQLMFIYLISSLSTLGPRDKQSQRRRDAATLSHKFRVIECLDAELVLKEEDAAQLISTKAK